MHPVDSEKRRFFVYVASSMLHKKPPLSAATDAGDKLTARYAHSRCARQLIAGCCASLQRP